MTKLSITGNHGTTVSFETGTLVSEALKKGLGVVKAGVAAAGDVVKAGAELVEQLAKAGVKIKDAAGQVITPAIEDLKKLAADAATYCKGAVKGTVNQIATLVNDAAKYCKEQGIKGLSTLDQVARYIKDHGPTITVTPGTAHTENTV
ncbi:MAG: hypothetical protein ACI9ZF_000177 [Bradyrhizobium sp.]|jgi:hypothetical protein